MSGLFPSRTVLAARGVFTSSGAGSARARLAVATAPGVQGQQGTASGQLRTPAAQRQFSATTGLRSKLGRTPITVPPGVDVKVGEPWVKKDLTTYLKTVKKTVTIEGPLGMFFPSSSFFIFSTLFPPCSAWVILGGDENEGF